MTDLKWHGERVSARFADEIQRRMGRAVQLLVREEKVMLNRSQPYRIQRTGKHAGRRIGLDPSKPGEPPKKVEGHLQNSIIGSSERRGNAIVGWFGSPLKKMLALERGTEKLKPRPSLRPTLEKNLSQVLHILRGA